VISELREPVVVDRERLVRLLDLTVMLTEDYSIPRLEKLYSLYAQCVYNHRMECNKTGLLEVSEKVQSCVRSLSQTVFFRSS